METNKNEFKTEKAESIELKVDKIQLEIEADHIRRVVILTNKGQITYKPKIQRKEYINGFETIKKDCIKIDEIDNILLDINNVLKEKGVCHVIGDYIVGTKEFEGVEKQYRFIQGSDMMNSWVIQPIPGLEETKVE